MRSRNGGRRVLGLCSLLLLTTGRAIAQAPPDQQPLQPPPEQQPLQPQPQLQVLTPQVNVLTPETPELDTWQRPGTVPVEVQAIEPLQLYMPREVHDELRERCLTGTEASGACTSVAVPIERRSYVCTTPCRMYLPPGGASLYVTGEGRMPGSVAFEVAPTGQRLLVRTADRLQPVRGLIASMFGGMGVFVGASLTGIGGFELYRVSHPYVDDKGELVAGNRSFGIGAVVSGVVLLGLGSWGLAHGIRLIRTHLPRIEHSTPLAPLATPLPAVP